MESCEEPHPKSQIGMVTTAEGGEAHCVVNNIPLANQIEFDWRDDVLGRKSSHYCREFAVALACSAFLWGL